MNHLFLGFDIRAAVLQLSCFCSRNEGQMQLSLVIVNYISYQSVCANPMMMFAD